MATESFEKLVVTNDARRPARPQASVENGSGARRYLSNIIVNLDAYFSLRGAVEIRIGTRTIFEAVTAGQFQNQQSININSANELIAPYEAIEIFAWNAAGTPDQIRAVFSFSTGTEPFAANITAESRSQLELNQEVSDSYVDPQVQYQLAKLDEVIAGLVTTRQNLGGKIDLTNTRLTNLDNQAVASETVTMAIADITAALAAAPAPAGANLAALTAIRTALVGLRDGFDLYELRRVIFAINTHAGAVADAALRGTLQSLNITLQLAAASPKLLANDQSTLFPKVLRAVTDETVLLDMKGFTNLIILLDVDNSAAPAPNVLTPVPANNPAAGNMVDNDDSTYLVVALPRVEGTIAASNYVASQFITRNITVRLRYNRVAGQRYYAFTLKLQYVSRAEVWVTQDTFSSSTDGPGRLVESHPASGNQNAFDVYEIVLESPGDPPFETGRQWRVLGRYAYISNSRNTNVPGLRILEMYDANFVGGKAELSFEIKTPDDVWLPYITSAELGSRVQNAARTIFYGARNDKLLPSSQTDFRMRLKVVEGSIKLGVSVIRIA